MPENKVLYRGSLLTEHDIYLFKEGNHFKLFEKMGSHLIKVDGAEGTHFALWAPNAEAVSVVGDFNGWNRDSHPLRVRSDGSGIWEGFIPGLGNGTIYKYHIQSRENGYRVDKGDPFAVLWEAPPGTASIVWDLEYEWGDGRLDGKTAPHTNALNAPHSVYEVHLGPGGVFLKRGTGPSTYREMAPTWWTMSRTWVLPMWSSCPSWNILFTAPGGIRRWATLLPPPVWHATGFHVSHRSAAPERNRRHPRLGAFAFSQRRARTCLF